MTRKNFMQTVAGAGAAAYLAEPAPAAPAPAKPKLGVTVYSYGPDIQSGRMTLEGCLADISDMEAEGVEILGESHIPDYPNPPAAWVKQWFTSLDKYGLKPAAYDTFVDTRFYRNRRLTEDEAVERMTVDFRLANLLGFKALRQMWPPCPADDPAEEIYAPYVASKEAMSIVMKALPFAEKYDVRMGIELHPPSQMKSAFVERIIDVVEKTKTKHFGFCPDLGSFAMRPQRRTLNSLIQQGARQNIVDYIVSAYQQKVGPVKTQAEVKKMGGNEIEINYAGTAGIYHMSNNDPKDLLPLIPYCYHCHAKFYEVTPELTEYSIPYQEIMRVFLQGGYTAYLDSEYEGPRDTYSTSAAVRAHHAMMRNFLGIA